MNTQQKTNRVRGTTLKTTRDCTRAIAKYFRRWENKEIDLSELKGVAYVLQSMSRMMVSTELEERVEKLEAEQK